MSNGTPQKRTRSQRVAALELPPGRLSALVERLRSGATLLRLCLATLLALTLLIVTRGWNPPRDFYLNKIPPRDLVAAVEFTQLNKEATADERDRIRRLAKAVYDNDPVPLVQLKEKVKNEVVLLAAAESYEAVDKELWAKYQPPRDAETPALTEEEEAARFEKFRSALAMDERMSKFVQSIDSILAPIERRGLLDRQPTEANSEWILVRRAKNDDFIPPDVKIRDVLIDNARDELKGALIGQLMSVDVAQHLFARLRPELPITLVLNPEATRAQQEREVEEQAKPVYRTFTRGAQLAEAGLPIGPAELELLELGYQKRLEERTPSEQLGRAVGVLWCYGALIALCGVGIYRSEPDALDDLSRFALMLGVCAIAMIGMLLTHGQAWRIELLPLMMLGMVLAIAYRHSTALLVTGSVTLVAAIAYGMSLVDLSLLIAPTITSIALLDSIRDRTKLLMVSLISGLVALCTTLALGTLEGQPFWPNLQLSLVVALLPLVAGSLVTFILPYVEKLFRVQTDMRLIELGDPAHPLLQELIRRAPGTYNHSITVASLAQAAAESIGARGLLVRVGAYFHDIGKMLKPGYFIENQGIDANQHDALVPAMSTLVIIAHVKDGADLARQHKLPECIIDFILQHHGTTLVEYFYRQEQQKRNESGEEEEVDESTFRYPGPKPQTREAGVLMLSDAVESASRTLVEPTPARIESLVDELLRKRLDDGQFDECGLTLQELRTVADSLIKSLTAVYHGRVKYPDQETA